MKHLLLPVALLSILIAGCAGQKELIEEQRSALEELAVENSRLESLNDVLRDSLQFVDDVDSGQYYRDRRQLVQRIDKLEYDLAVALDSSQIPLTEVAHFRADELFAPASADITEAGAARLVEVGRNLPHSESRMIRVEGHSDSVPVGPGLIDRYPSNWELSAARAAAVARFLMDRNGLNADRFEVVGFGDTRPVASNQTNDGRSRNRRVSILLY